MQIRKVFFKTLGALMAVALLIAALPAGQVHAEAVDDRETVILSAADWIVSNQNTDGGFPWILPSTTSTTNTLGVTAIGVLKAHSFEEKAIYEQSLAKAYDYVVDNPPVYTWDGTKFKDTAGGIDSFPDFTFLVWLAELAETDTTLLAAINDIQEPDITADDIANLAKTRWDDMVLKVGSTQQTSPDGTATLMAQRIRETRHAQNSDSLIPWDLEAAIKAALTLDGYFSSQGYLQQALDIASVIDASIDDTAGTYFSSTDTTQTDYVLGLTGAIEAFVEVSGYATSVDDLKAKLLDVQQTDGSWMWHDVTAPAAWSTQSTAYAVMALYAQGDEDALSAARKGAAFLVENQKVDGGWLAETDWQEDVLEVDSEVAWALATLPAPVTIGELGYYSIQLAVDSATAGATINVSPGTYIEGTGGEKALDLTVANLTVRSTDGRDVTIIDANEATTGVWVNQNLGTVTFDGFTVKNFVANGVVQSYTQREGTAFHILNSLVDSSNGYLRNGLQVSGDNSTVKNNIVYGAPLDDNWSSTGIGVINANNVLVSGNTVQGDIEDASNPDIGINVMNHGALASDITIEQNTVKNAGDGVRISAADPSYVVKNVTIDNNIINENTWGINVHKAVLENVTITNNTIQSNYDDLLDDDGPLYGSGIRFSDESATVTNASISGNTFSDNETYQVFGHTGALIDVPAVLSANTFDNAVTIDGDYVIYSSIQDAIDDASDGATIDVYPGTYVESLKDGVSGSTTYQVALLLNKPNITIQSVGTTEETIIDVPQTGGLTTGVFVEANMGTVTFDGFTIQNFGETGIVQGSANATGTTFHVKNNIVTPVNGYLRNGIQVTGTNSTVIGNFINGAPLTDDWASTAIFAYADGVLVEGNTVVATRPIGDPQVDIGVGVYGSNVTVRNNVVQGAKNGIRISSYGGPIDGVTIEDNVLFAENYDSSAAKMGINIQSASVSNLTVNNNKIQNVAYGFRVSPTSADLVGPITLRHNQFENNYWHLLYYNDPATLTIDAEENWWDSIAGPADSGFGSLYLGTTGLVDYVPWCGDASCNPENLLPKDGEIDLTPPEGEHLAAEEIQTAINNAPEYTTIIIPAGNYGQEGAFVISTEHITITLSEGTVIQNNSPCFEITASYTTITGNGAVCIPTDDSNGIDVAAGLTNIIIEGLEIDGTDQTTGDGINFAGAITDVILRDNFIHDLGGDGVYFASQPSGYVKIKGNLFKNNEGVGITNMGSYAIDATYNAWGDYNGPNGTNGDGVSSNVNYYPWTHVDLDMESSGTDVANEVRVGETITYTIKANLKRATGADFKLLFDPDFLEVTSTTLGSIFTVPATGSDVVTTDNTTGEVHFAGGSVLDGGAEQSGKDLVLFTLTFTAIDDGVSDLEFAEDNFYMSPTDTTSTNIYAAKLEDGSVTIGEGLEYINYYLPIVFH